jgi:NAD-dependent deacetylase
MNPNYILDWKDDLVFGDLDNQQNQLRTYCLVWREVPELEQAVSITETADYFAVIGTSLQVYPAAGLIDFTNAKTPIYYIDPKPIKIEFEKSFGVIPEIASEGMKQLKKALISLI